MLSKTRFPFFNSSSYSYMIVSLNGITILLSVQVYWNVYLIICNIYVDWTRLATKWMVIGVYHKINCIEDNSPNCLAQSLLHELQRCYFKEYKPSTSLRICIVLIDASSAALNVLCCDHNFCVKHWNFEQTKTLIYLPWKWTMIVYFVDACYAYTMKICRGRYDCPTSKC